MWMLCSVLALSPGLGSSPAGPQEDLGPFIDAWAEDAVRAGHLSGSLFVARGDDLLVERHWGFANRELGVPNGSSTRFCIASITKPITGVIARRLMDEGKLRAGDSLQAFLPDFPRAEDIKVQMLLDHRAGIPHRPVDRSDVHEPRSAAFVTGEAAKQPLLFEPGTDSNYSTGGYSVLARVLEVAGGEDYDTLVQRYVAGPLELAGTRHVSDREVLRGRATSYVFGPRGMRHADQQDTSYLVGGGSIYSNPRDLYTFARALRAGELGERARNAYERSNGYRWNGVTDGFRAFADHHLEEDLYVLFCGNVHSGATDLLREAIPRLVRGEELEPLVVPRASPQPITEEQLRRAEGVFELRPGSELTIRTEAGALVINDWLLIPESAQSFFSPQDYARVELRLGDEGEVEGLEWTQAGETWFLPKLSAPIGGR